MTNMQPTTDVEVELFNKIFDATCDFLKTYRGTVETRTEFLSRLLRLIRWAQEERVPASRCRELENILILIAKVDVNLLTPVREGNEG